MEPFVLATGNADKAHEVTEIFAARLGIELVTAAVEAAGQTVGFVIGRPGEVAAVVSALRPLAEPPDVEESGTTLEENAHIKAAGVGAALGVAAIADDTGLMVDALDGAPGVRSARYAGAAASYADNVDKLLDALSGVEPGRRTARFATAALAWAPSGAEIVAHGEVAGRIAVSPRGTGGFGYDPVFVPDEGGGKSFAEMSPSEKHTISHRGRAFSALADELARR